VQIVDVEKGFGEPTADAYEAPAGFEELRRTPHLDLGVATCPPVGERFEVALFCDASSAHPDEFSQDVSVYGPKEQNEFRIEAFLAPGLGLRVVGASTGKLLLRRDEMESKPLRFQVEVQEPPAGDSVVINAYFFYGGRPCGSVTRILPTKPSASVPGTSGTLAAVRGAKAADLTVSVTRRSGTVGCYQVRLTSPHLTPAEIGEPGVWDLGGPSQNYVGSLFKEFVNCPDDPNQRLAELRGAGKELFAATPQSFKDCYQRLMAKGKLRTMLIVSDEPYIPWELMVPASTQDEAARGIEYKPLGVAHAVGRWLSDKHLSPVGRLRMGNSMVIAPDYKNTALKVLPQSAEEATYLKDRFGAKMPTPSLYSTIVTALKDQPPDLFHFIGHGNSAAEAPAQCLHLENQDRLSPNAARGEPAFTVAFAKRTPLVFLNACEVAQQILTLGGPAGFVPTFIKLFASGVIAPLWSVRDSIAHVFARDLYEGAVPRTGAPVPIAEVVRKLRARAYSGSEKGEDTYAAYCFYGDPNFILEIAS
jgi:CHAT domain